MIDVIDSTIGGFLFHCPYYRVLIIIYYRIF